MPAAARDDGSTSMTLRVTDQRDSIHTDFCTYRHQPLMLLTSGWSGRRLKTFLLVLLVYVLSRLAVTVPFGTFGSLGDLTSDIGRLLNTGQAGSPSAGVPWLRDYADIALIVIISGHIAHLVCQWQRLNGLPGRLSDASLLAPSIQEPGTYNHILNSYGARFNAPWLEVAAIVLASVLAASFATLPEAGGIYAGLGTPASAADRFAGWWANPGSHPAGFVVLIAGIWFYLYFLVRSLLMGSVVFRLFLAATRTATNAGEPWLGYSDPWMGGKGEAAIRELRGALNDIAMTLAFMALGILVVSVYVTLPLVILVLIGFPYLISNLFSLFFTSSEMNRCVGLSWTALRASALEKQAKAVMRATNPRSSSQAHVAELRLAASAIELARIDDLPREVIGWRSRAAAFLIYMVPVLALLPAFLGHA